MIFREKFYAFPCEHSFHFYCILDFIRAYRERRNPKTTNEALGTTLDRVVELSKEVLLYEMAE